MKQSRMNWLAADNVYELGTDTFVVRDGKIMAQSFTSEITPKAESARTLPVGGCKDKNQTYV